jgi:small subunit ribosomal protein S6
MKYELSFIIGPNVPETEHKTVEQEILDNLKKLNANITKQPYSIGRKKLAYPIKKQKHGFYVFLEFEAEEKEGLADFDVKLKHNNNILRHLLIKKDKVSAKAAKSGTGKPKAAAPAIRPELKSEKTSVEIEKKREGVKVNLDDIDKQLDEILDKDL